MQKRDTFLRWILLLVLIHSSAGISTNDFDFSRLENSTFIEKTIKYIKDANPLGSDEKCMQMQCCIFCFNGKIENLSMDVSNAINSTYCEKIEDLHLYFYEFPNNAISKGFLGNLSNNVENLRILSSSVKWISTNAFEMDYLKSLHLENLQLDIIEDDVLKNAPESLNSLAIIQKDKSVQQIGSGFLSPVKYNIRKLTMNVGLMTTTNLTSSDCLLSGLEEVDLSFNNFENNLSNSSFSRLSMVVDLNLSNSNITFLPENIFFLIIDTIRKLDLSNNFLKAISMNIFGWQTPVRDFKMLIGNNEFECSCEGFNDMQELQLYLVEPTKCVSPENNTGLSDFDARLCSYSDVPPTYTTPLPLTTYKVPTTTDTKFGSWESNNEESNNVFECKNDEHNDTSVIVIEPQKIDFTIRRFSSTAIEISFQEDLDMTLAIIWFRDVTTQYYKMEVNYNAYGLGCFTNLTRYTLIAELHPDTSYTFCIIQKGQMNISPLSCKAFHMTTNLQVGFNLWISKSMRTTGISLLVFGILLFMFFGICLVFYIIRQKPTIVKGSKRVVMPNNSSSDIIVFPKRDSKDKGRLSLSQRNSSSSFASKCRRPSIISNDSNQSYMTPNIYEAIPAYQRYLKTLSDEELPDSIDYAEIPFRKTRMSSDPLPDIPNLIITNGIFHISQTSMIEDSHI